MENEGRGASIFTSHWSRGLDQNRQSPELFILLNAHLLLSDDDVVVDCPSGAPGKPAPGSSGMSRMTRGRPVRQQKGLDWGHLESR